MLVLISWDEILKDLMRVIKWFFWTVSEWTLENKHGRKGKNEWNDNDNDSRKQIAHPV